MRPSNGKHTVKLERKLGTGVQVHIYFSLTKSGNVDYVTFDF